MPCTIPGTGVIVVNDLKALPLMEFTLLSGEADNKPLNKLTTK